MKNFMNTAKYFNASVKDRKGCYSKSVRTEPFSSLKAYSRCEIVSQDSSIELPKRPTNMSKFKYTGQEEDKESGLMYYKARYYDPSLGRFLQADSTIFNYRTFGMNQYMYVDGKPSNYRDPSGHDTKTNLGWALMAYVANSHTGFAATNDQAAIVG